MSEEVAVGLPAGKAVLGRRGTFRSAARWAGSREGAPSRPPFPGPGHWPSPHQSPSATLSASGPGPSAGAPHGFTGPAGPGGLVGGLFVSLRLGTAFSHSLDSVPATGCGEETLRLRALAPWASASVGFFLKGRGPGPGPVHGARPGEQGPRGPGSWPTEKAGGIRGGHLRHRPCPTRPLWAPAPEKKLGPCHSPLRSCSQSQPSFKQQSRPRQAAPSPPGHAPPLAQS